MPVNYEKIMFNLRGNNLFTRDTSAFNSVIDHLAEASTGPITGMISCYTLLEQPS